MGNAAYDAILIDLLKRLEALMKVCGDEDIPESPETLKKWRDDAEQRLKRFKSKRGLEANISDEACLEWYKQTLMK